MARKLIPGVYRITNAVTGDCYVGSSKHVFDRCHEHWRLLRKGTHVNKHLQAAWNKYGEGAFACDVLEECALEAVIEREQHWIDTLQPVYNNRKTAAWVDRSRKESLEAIAKRKRPATRAQLDALAKGWQRQHGKHDPETIALIKTKRAKQVLTPAMLEALKQGQEIRKVVNPKPRLGMKSSEETRQKQSESASQRKHTPETIEKLRAAKRGKKQSEESNRKRSETLKANKRVWTEEQRQRIAEANRTTWAKKSAEEKHSYTLKRKKTT